MLAVLCVIVITLPDKNRVPEGEFVLAKDINWEVIKDFLKDDAPVIATVLAEKIGKKDWEAHAKKMGLDKLYYKMDSLYGDFVRERCIFHGFVPWQEVLCVICKESSGKPNAVSPKGAIGLMGVMPVTGREHGIKDSSDLFQPYINIDVGIRELVKLKKNNLSHSEVFLKYNHGSEGSKKVIGQENRSGYYSGILGILAAANKYQPIEKVAKN
ncbi:MAG: lytic transglycosylase domain-containing protein [Patescibacteria group bacterium]